VIQVKDLRAGYRAGFRRAWREVLQGVSFSVPRGSITGYLGVNGAGKTTTIKVLVGINPPAGGAVTIGGHPAGSHPAQQLLGYFPEAPFFYDGLTARELLAFYASLSGKRSERPEALLEMVGLEHAIDMPVRGYSKGMRQRLGLAQALVHSPELLVLDEPLDGLDPMGRLHLRNLIAEQGERGRTVFFSSHVLNDVEAVCDRLVLLDGGSIAYDGPTRDLTADAAARVSIHFELEALAEVEAAAGAAPQARGDGTHELMCPDQATADRVVAAVVHGGGRLLSMRSQRPSLEEYFLERFGRSAAPTPSSGSPDATSEAT
jgi:ABC-2 type transport system ATP-binding protein